jgi:DHA1 family inner membrane transport protein
MGAPTSNSSSTAQSDYRFPWPPLVLLAAAIFVAVTSEFVPVGLLPDLAATFGVSQSQVGLLVTIFAGSVVLSAAPLTALTRNVPRKKLVIAVLIAFAVANLLAAVAPTYTVLVLARVLGGVAHGLFWSIVGAYTGYLVPKHHLGRAVAITSGGGSAAFVLGVPLGTALGQALGWRLTFGVIAATIAVILLLVLKFLPAITHGVQLKTGEIAIPMRKDKTVLGVVLLCLIVLITMNAHYVFYTYISPYLTTIAGFEESSIAPLLFLFGGAGAIGLVISGLVTDKYPRAGLVVAFVIVAASVLVIATVPGNTPLVLAAIVIWAIAFGGAPAMMQTRLLHTASPRIRDAASAWYTTAFNAAIGLGALVGGGLLDAYSLEILPYVDVALLVVGIIVLLVSNVIVQRRNAPRDVSLSTGSISTIGSP